MYAIRSVEHFVKLELGCVYDKKIVNQRQTFQTRPMYSKI